MLYLAEVQKQKAGFMGGAKSELKLLAFQRADQSWNPVPGEEVITTEEANNFNSGALVLAELNTNRQVQGIKEAGRPLVSILQNFSRQMEKSKSQEEEIKQWKQSLAYQSQELSQRQMEMEARLEQLEHMDEEFQQLEAQQQEIESRRQKTEQLQAEIERNRQELEGAWQHLRGEQRRLKEQQVGFGQTTMLDEASACQIQELLDRLSNSVVPTEAIGEQLNFAFEFVGNQQAILDPHWQQLEQQRAAANQQQEEVLSQSLALQNSNQELQQAKNSWEYDKTQLQVQLSALNSKQEYAQMLALQLRNKEELYQQIYELTESFEQLDFSQNIDLEVLENMPLDQLQQVVQDLQRDWENAFRFVNEQEEELRFNQQMIEELQAKLNQANDHDRSNLEMEIAEEQNSYQFLNQTLVGQRQNLQERKQLVSQHQSVLWRRQGIEPAIRQQNYRIDLGSMLVQIEVQRQQQTQQLQKLEQEIEQMRSRIVQVQGMIASQAAQQEMKRQELPGLEQNLLFLRTAMAESWGRVNLYQEMLQPVQDSLDRLRQKLEAIANLLNQLPSTTDEQTQAISQMRQTLVSIMPSS